MVNANLTRWINASVDKYFNTNKGSYTLYVEGTEPNLKDAMTWAELRKTGPNINPQSQGEFEITLDINILCGNKQDKKDFHKIHRIVGHFQNLMKTIHVYRYGPDVLVDTGAFVGCLELRQDLEKPISTIPWGVLDESMKIENVTVEAFYCMNYSE